MTRKSLFLAAVHDSMYSKILDLYKNYKLNKKYPFKIEKKMSKTPYKNKNLIKLLLKISNSWIHDFIILYLIITYDHFNCPFVW